MRHSSRGLVALVVAISVATASGIAQPNPIAYEEYTLPNGLHVILHQDLNAPLATTVLHYKVGSRDENPKRTGFAHFFEHLMFEGTKNIPRASIDKYVEGVGGRLNAYTSFDETVYHFEVPSNEIRLPLWIESQRMRGLVINPEGVETQRGVVKEERKARYDNSPYGTAGEKLFQTLFAGGSYSWTPIGSAQHIDSASIPEFQTFYNTFYQPNNAVLVVAGNFDKKQIKEDIRTYFGSIPRGSAVQRETFTLPDLTKEYVETVKDKKAQLPAVFMAYRGASYTSEDSYALRMLTYALSNGESSRLYSRLVDKEQAAVQAGGYMQPLEKSGLLQFVGIASPGKDLATIVKLIDEELERVKSEGISDAEFEKVKNIAETYMVENKSSLLSAAMALSSAHVKFGNTAMVNDEIKQFSKVTKADIQRVAKKYLNNNTRIILNYLPEANQ